MSTESGFPPGLLTEPKDKRLAYFESKVVAHPRLVEVHEAFKHAIRQPAGATLIQVFGPTGVGKTTLRQRIVRQLLEEAHPELERDPGYIPVAWVEAVSPDVGNFNWKDYYTRCLLALEEPHVDDKLDDLVRGLYLNGRGQLVISKTVATTELRRALEKCLQHRRPQAFLVDEAQHLKKVSSGRRVLDQMDALKSLANMSNTVHVLIGTYDLLGLLDLSGQLSRRSVDIHFARYRADDPAEVVDFQRVLRTFQRHLPLTQEPDLVARWEYFYEGSVGCVGVLKQWLSRALDLALETGETTLTEKCLKARAEPERHLLRLAREIQEGEDLLRDQRDQRVELRTLLGMSQVPAQESASRTPRSHNASRRNGRVGQRKPKRDAVGLAGHDA